MSFPMQYRRPASCGLQLSALSFGSWVTFGTQISDETAAELMKTAWEAGVNFFDNAELYAEGQAEIIMGNILKRFGWPRESWCVSSKVFWGPTGRGPTSRGLSRKHIVEACNAALRRLQVDYLDLFFCHRPDAETPIVETVAAMTDLIRQGKVLYWGTSEWTARDIMEAFGAARENGLYAPVFEQPQYNLFHRERFEVEYAPLYDRLGLGTTIWSPLASGLLTGKYTEGIPSGTRVTLPGYERLGKRLESDEGRQRIAIVRKLAPLAADLGMTLARLAIAWCLKHPDVTTVILGASRAEQVRENLLALGDAEKLTTEVMEAIEEIAGTRPKPEPVF